MLRYDATTQDWVVLAPSRSRRPHELKAQAPVEKRDEPLCPFCAGNEHLTDREILAVRSGTPANAPGWKVRVVPNRFPALTVEADVNRVEEAPLFRQMGGCGAHEVIIESPEHELVLAHQPVEQIALLLGVLQDRFNDLMRDQRFQTIVIFKNHGERAGTSLRHPHWQLIATPVVPALLRRKHAVAATYFDATGKCIYCDVLAAEKKRGVRVFASNDEYVAIVPFAAHVPFETWILPTAHFSSFGRVPRDQLRSLAPLLKHVLTTLHAALDNPDFNLVIDSAPRGDEDKRYFLWHVRILPRLTVPAGFELGSGMSINTVAPEEAATFLRDLGGSLVP